MKIKRLVESSLVGCIAALLSTSTLSQPNGGWDSFYVSQDLNWRVRCNTIGQTNADCDGYAFEALYESDGKIKIRARYIFPDKSLSGDASPGNRDNQFVLYSGLDINSSFYPSTQFKRTTSKEAVTLSQFYGSAQQVLISNNAEVAATIESVDKRIDDLCIKAALRTREHLGRRGTDTEEVDLIYRLVKCVLSSRTENLDVPKPANEQTQETVRIVSAAKTVKNDIIVAINRIGEQRDVAILGLAQPESDIGGVLRLRLKGTLNISEQVTKTIGAQAFISAMGLDRKNQYIYFSVTAPGVDGESNSLSYLWRVSLAAMLEGKKPLAIAKNSQKNANAPYLVRGLVTGIVIDQEDRIMLLVNRQIPSVNKLNSEQSFSELVKLIITPYKTPAF